MAFLYWIKQRKERVELKALAGKYGHDAIGTPGAAFRHFEKLMDLRKETGSERGKAKTTPRRPPSWER
jgi:hypothetical protein